METFSALLALTGHLSIFPQRPATRIFDVFFDLHLNERLSKQSRHRFLRRHRTHYDVTVMFVCNSCHNCNHGSAKPPVSTLHIYIYIYVYINVSVHFIPRWVCLHVLRPGLHAAGNADLPTGTRWHHLAGLLRGQPTSASSGPMECLRSWRHRSVPGSSVETMEGFIWRARRWRSRGSHWYICRYVWCDSGRMMPR